MAGLPGCCTNSSHGEGVVMSCNQASYGRFFKIFLYFYIFPNPCIWSFLKKQSVRLMTLLVFLCPLWAGSDFPLLLLSASCFTFPNVCTAAVLNTWEPSQNSSSKSAPLTSLELFSHCWYKSHNLYRLGTHRKERTELLYIYLNLYYQCPPSQLLCKSPLYYQIVTLCRFLDCALSYLLVFSAVILQFILVYFSPCSLSFAPFLLPLSHSHLPTLLFQVLP